MKKLSLLIITIFLVIGITACDTNIIEIPIETNEPVVPVEREPDTNTVDVSPEVIVEFVDRFIDVPANVERQRQYLPGTYMLAEAKPNNQNGYVFTVVVIDDFGYIAGVYIDQTVTTRNLFRSPSGRFYTLVTGNRINIPDAYRHIELETPYADYPTMNDAIRTIDLVVGIDTEPIRALFRISVNETKQLTAVKANLTSGLNYQQQMQLVAEKIINDNTTYGFNLVEKNGILTTSSLPGLTEALDVPLFLVQSILDGPAALAKDTVLPSVTPRYGMYQTGMYATFSPMAYADEALVYGFSFLVVDDFGRMTGLYLDEIVASTARSTVVASKQILQNAVGLSTTQPLEWFEQVNAVAQQILTNQGIQGLTLAGTTAFDDELVAGLETLRITNMTNVVIRANELLLATKENMAQALITDYVDGTYYSISPNAFAYVTIQDQRLVDLYVDRFVQREQAQVFRRNQISRVERFVREFMTPTGTVSEDVVVYAIGSSYYSVHDLTQVSNLPIPVNQTLEKDQLISLSDEERATLRPVPGWQTASSLRLIEASQETWIRDQEALTELIVRAGSITDFQLVNGRIPSQSSIAQMQVSTVFDLVADAFFKARQVTNSGFSVPFVPQTSPLADGSYFEYSGPEANGPMHFTYMVVQDGEVLTWIVDSTVLRNNRLTSQLFSAPINQPWIELSNALRQSQQPLFASLIDKVAPSPKIQSIRSATLRDANNDLLGIAPYEAVLNQVIRQAVVAKQAQDIAWIRNHFLTSETLLKDKSFISLRFDERLLLGSIVDPQLSYEYRLVWRSDDRDITMTKDGDFYSVRVALMAEDRTGILEMEIYLPESNSPISRQLFEVPIRQLSTYGADVLNSKVFDLPSNTLVEQAQYALPTSDEVTVSWRSSRPEVISNAGQTFAVTQATTVELTAFVDLDASGTLSANEPTRTYTVTVLPLALAISRLTSELDTNQIDEFVGNRISLENKSSIWGLTYQWSSNSANVKVVTSGTNTVMYIASLDVQQNIQITANVNIPNNNISNSYRVNVGNKELYTRFATADLPKMNNQTALISGQSIFQTSITQGQFYRSNLSVTASDFGQFIDDQGIVIFQHPTLEACFEAEISSNYSGGVQTASVAFNDSFCIMSLKMLQTQMNEDRDQLQDYIIDLTFTSHVDTPLTLPLQGYINQHPIRWEVVADQEELLQYFDLTNVSSGLVVVKTATTEIPVGLSLRLNAIIDVTAGSPSVSSAKEITIEVQD